MTAGNTEEAARAGKPVCDPEHLSPCALRILALGPWLIFSKGVFC